MWILSTFKRQPLAQRFLDSLQGAAPGRVLVDGGDPYDGLQLPPGWTYDYYPDNIGYLPRCNQVFFENPNEPWYGIGGDDIVVPPQPGWDKRLIDAAGPLGFSNCSDSGYKDHEPFPTGVHIFGGDLVRAMGFIAVPGCRHTYADDAWMNLFAAFPGLRVTCNDIRIEHLHVNRGLAVNDEAHQKAYAFVRQDYEAWGTIRATGEWDRAMERVRIARGG
jgi:hypothetical protein